MPISYPEVDINQILVVEDELGRRILQKNENGKLQRISFEAQRLPGFPRPLLSSPQIQRGARVVIIRGGGIGDVLMSLPAIRELKRHLPDDTHITLSTFRSNVPLFENIPELDAVTAQPMTLARFMEMDYYAEFNDPNSEMSSMHMIDFYIKSIGLDPAKTHDKSISLPIGSLFDQNVAELIKEAGRSFRSTVYLNGLASDMMRDLPPSTLLTFPENLKDHLFIFPKSYSERYGQKVSDITARANVLHLDTIDSLSGYLTALHSCDAVVTTDSSSYHIAAALNKPCLAIFGPISANLRTTYYPGVIALEPNYMGRLCRSPCGKSMFAEFPENKDTDEKRCPEAALMQMDFSPCLASFSREDLIDAFLALQIGAGQGRTERLHGVRQ
ncbi:MAG: hypothetical protein JRJ85_16820 [Deltaproteobacteria bacterium]|nr:hypothetical protein [Deltaproteobacteria bacterium]